MDETFVYLFGGTSRNGTLIPGIQYPRNLIEVIVADGDSTDNTVMIIEQWRKKYKCIKLVKIPMCKSRGQARNEALAIAKGEYVLFTDGDCAPNADWVDKILEPFQRDSQVGLVGGEIRATSSGPADKVGRYCAQSNILAVGDRVGKKNGGYYGPVRWNLPREVNGSQNTPFFAMANAAVSREALRAIGNSFWDETASEDVDLSLRIHKAGYKLYFQPDAQVLHVHGTNLSQFCRQLGEIGFGHPLTMKTHSRRILEVRFQYFGDFSLYIPFPLQAMVYWGDFHFMHLFGFWTFYNWYLLKTPQLSWALISHKPALLYPALAFLFFVLRYFSPCLKLRPLGDFLFWCWVRYRSNLALFMGGIRGALKSKRPYVEMSW
jgi:cellulose synthase/poly-beta-1,6-N-acetylglucosamine synthase-like glycosyltransferase